MFSGTTVVLGYVVPAAVCLALLLTFLLDARVRLLVALTLLPGAMAAIAAEVFLASFAGTPWRESARASDRRSQGQVVSDFRQQGDRAFPAMAPLSVNYWKNTSSRVYPLSGVSDVTTVFCNESGSYLVYRSDAHGFNNKSSDAWRSTGVPIAAVGDSYVQGACVSPDSNAVSVIAQHVPGALNLGVWGSGPMSQLAVITEYLPELKPRRVLFFFFEGNDFNDLAGERGSPVLRSYLAGQRQGLANRQSEVDSMWATVVQPDAGASRPKSTTERVTDILRMPRLRGALGFAMTPPYDPLFDRVLRRANAVVRSWGGELIVVYLPAHLRYEAGPPWGRGAALRKTRQKILAAAASSSLRVIDLTPAFDSHSARERLWYTPGSHYSPAGYRLVGETIARALAHVP